MLYLLFKQFAREQFHVYMCRFVVIAVADAVVVVVLAVCVVSVD